MLKENLPEGSVADDEEETVFLNNPDSGFIDIEQETGGLNSDAVPVTKVQSSSTLAVEAERLSSQGFLEKQQQDSATEEWSMPSERIRGYWSAGAEVYYSATEKLGGGNFFYIWHFYFT